MGFDNELKKLLEEWRSEVGKIDKSLLPLVDKFIKANKGGKGIRGNLVILGYQIASSEFRIQSSELENKEILKVAAAYEIFHTAILAHDDIIDKSPERRGQQSLYQALGGDHRGISLAITLADAGFFLATKIISEADFPEKRKNEALKYFSSIMLNTAMGQILDIEKGDPLTVAKYKTAKYTVSGPLVLGAILAGARLDKLTQLDQFGEAVGIAFQIQDDILDGETKKYKQSLQQLDYFKNKALKIIPDITKDSKMSKILEQLTADLVNRIK